MIAARARVVLLALTSLSLLSLGVLTVQADGIPYAVGFAVLAGITADAAGQAHLAYQRRRSLERGWRRRP
ncbi:hypothetical protein [Streptomyces sp. SID3212]|uniref:hypothetical protein n=1 Tax=Streptomyces sp. SID3212 TaxID=2690259 RepID=UPI0013695AC8|nr:hypothetical protein [Streptomyces sp. SID3212]MYV56470.1 hypothetical protein [Streptomyces sp. SID3212]